MAILDDRVRAVLKIIQKLDTKEKGAQIRSLYYESNWPQSDIDQYLMTAEEHDLVAKFDGGYRLTDLGKQFMDRGVQIKDLDKLRRYQTTTISPVTFSWGEVPVKIEKIEGQYYKIAIMDLRGRGAPKRRKEAKEKGYGILNLRQLETLKQIAPHVKDKVIDAKIAAEAGIRYESQLLVYRSAGINITLKYVSQASPRKQETKPEIKTKEKPRGEGELDKLLGDYKAGQEQSYQAMEYIVNELRQKDAKISNLEERLGKLEKRVKK